MSASRIDPELIHPDATVGKAALVGDAVDTVIASINGHADLLDTFSAGTFASLAVGSGKFTVNGTTGNTFVGGTLGTNSTIATPRVIVTGAQNQDAITASFVSTAQTPNGLAAIRGTNSGTFDTTAQALTEYGVIGIISATRSAGASTLTNVAGYFDAQNGQANQAIIADHGDVILNNTSGTTTIKGNVGFQGTAPIAKPTVTGSRGGNAALASLLTALASYGLIIDGTSA